MRRLGLVSIACVALGCATPTPRVVPARETPSEAPIRQASPAHAATLPLTREEPAGEQHDPPAPQLASTFGVLVVDAEGRPIEGARVERDFPSGGFGGGGWSDPDGRYEFRYQWQPRPHRVRAQSRYHRGATQADVPTDLGGRPLRVVIASGPAGSIEARLVDPQLLMPGMCVTAVPGSETDDEVRFGSVGGRHGFGEHFLGLAPGQWFLRLHPRWSSPRASQLPVEVPVTVVAGQTADVRFPTQPSPVLRGVLRLPGGHPIAPRPPGAWIDGTGGFKVTLTFGWPSDAAGRVRTRKEGAGSHPSGWDVEWDGKVVQAETYAETGVTEHRTTLATRPDQNGRFAFHSVPPWPATLRVEHDGAIVHETQVASGAAALNLSVQPALPSLRLLVAESDIGKYGWRVTVWRAGRLLGDQSGAGPSLVLRGIAPGPAVAVVQRFDGGHRRWSKTFDPHEPETESLEQSWHAVEISAAPVTIQPSVRRGALLWVRAVDDDTGLPLESWTTTFVWRGQSWRPPGKQWAAPSRFHETHRSQGHLRFLVPSEEPFHVRVSAPGRVSVVREVRLHAGEMHEMPDVRLSRPR